jgi:hypothetical protein
MAADEDDCVSYACECLRLAGLTDDEPVTRRFVTAEEPPLTNGTFLINKSFAI